MCPNPCELSSPTLSCLHILTIFIHSMSMDSDTDSTSLLRKESLMLKESASEAVADMYMNEIDKSMISPRTAYLEGCLDHNLNPRASLILRKNLSNVLDLSHHAMGDEVASVFAASLRKLPYVHTLILADNNLRDVGATAVIQAISGLKSLTCLDLSMNKLDGEAANALARFLKSSSCPIVKLKLQSADIDDTECDKFITAIKHNTTIKELDMSRNKIGISESLNSIQPEFRTGAEALGNFLRSLNCPLESLVLAWNMIRLDGAVNFASALRVNSSITYLDISFNSLGQHGGEMLGVSSHAQV